MKKLIWSSFAVSLTFLSPLALAQLESVDDFLGLEGEEAIEKEIAPEIQAAAQAESSAPVSESAPSEEKAAQVKPQKSRDDIIDQFLGLEEEDNQVMGITNERPVNPNKDLVDDFLDLEEGQESLIKSKGPVVKGSQEHLMGLENQLMPELKGEYKFSSASFHQSDDWKVKDEDVEIDPGPLKGQNRSLIFWPENDPVEWLDIDNWLLDRAAKDKSSAWKQRLRFNRNSEHMGKVLQCRGDCQVFRGTSSSNVQHLSRVDEGDELRTGKDSMAWVYLMDGSLVRIGPRASISFQEINWTPSETFVLIRLNQGHLFWNPWTSKEFPLDTSPETDAISLPLLVREANLEKFERKLFLNQNDSQRIFNTMELSRDAMANQVAELNQLKKVNAEKSIPKSRVMIVAPNATIVSSETSFDFLHYPGGKAFFKKRSPGELELSLRGYSAADIYKIADDRWVEINAIGREHVSLDEAYGHLQVTDLLTKRIKTLELAREIWLGTYTIPVVNDLKDQKILAAKHGYALWGDELKQRLAFLVEYNRRMETTNLRSIDNLLKKLADNGEKIENELSKNHYEVALGHYLQGLKSQYSSKRTQIKEMNDLQYYVWILKNGKP